MNERLLQLGAHRIKVTEDGDSTGPVFILIHGVGASSHYFTPLIETLSLHARVFALDLPGFGGSSTPNHVLTLRELAEVVRGLIMHEQLEDATLLGQSMGCQVALEFMRQHPAVAKKIVLVGPTVDSHRRTILRHASGLALDALREPLPLHRIMLKDYLTCGIPRYLKTLRYMLNDRPEDKKTAPGRMLVIRGQHDPIVNREWAEQLARDSSGEYKEIPHAPHNAHWTHAHDVAGRALAFTQE